MSPLDLVAPAPVALAYFAIGTAVGLLLGWMVGQR